MLGITGPVGVVLTWTRRWTVASLNGLLLPDPEVPRSISCGCGAVSGAAGPAWGLYVASLSEVALACADKSADVVTGPHSEIVEFSPAASLGQSRDVCKHVLRGLAQRFVVREHLHTEEGFLGIGAQVVGADAHGVRALGRGMFVLTEPEVNEAATVVDQRAGIDGVGIEPLLSERLATGELMASVGGALLERQGDRRAQQRSQDGYGAGEDGLHGPS